MARKNFCGEKHDNLCQEITSVARKNFCVDRKENFCGNRKDNFCGKKELLQQQER